MGDSKFEELLAGLREEDSRLESELSDAEKRVKEVKSELSKVRSGIKALSGKENGRKRVKRNAAERKTTPVQPTDLP